MLSWGSNFFSLSNSILYIRSSKASLDVRHSPNTHSASMEKKAMKWRKKKSFFMSNHKKTHNSSRSLFSYAEKRERAWTHSNVNKFLCCPRNFYLIFSSCIALLSSAELRTELSFHRGETRELFDVKAKHSLVHVVIDSRGHFLCVSIEAVRYVSII